MDLSHEAKAKAKDSTFKAKTKDFKIVLEDPRGQGLVLEDSNTDESEYKSHCGVCVEWSTYSIRQSVWWPLTYLLFII